MNDMTTATDSLVRPNMTPAQRCRYVADIIEAHPENFDMDFWIAEGEGATTTMPTLNLVTGDWRPGPVCGTTYCIGGWTVAVTPPEEIAAILPEHLIEATWVSDDFFIDHIGPLLGVTDRHEASVLFIPDIDEYDNWTVAEAAFLLRWHADELERDLP